MLVAIAGGSLQGLEMTYLARKAGFETLLLDKKPDAPATGICDRFVAIDLTDQGALALALGSVDLVIPATEDVHALRSLVSWCERHRMPLAFDSRAYAISSSKRASNALFKELGIPAPTPWPECAFPVVAKPDGESGSKGVEVFPDLSALEARFGTLPPHGRVLQEYVPGPSCSIEVMGHPGNYTPLQITDLEMDLDHDCKRVLAPSRLSADLTDQFTRIAVVLAEALGLTGIMDVEAMYQEDRLEVLEIDARFPSQTPIAVYSSTGVNMVERLARLFTGQREKMSDPIRPRSPRGVVIEHIRVGAGHLAVRGEHIMTEDGPLHLESSFFGADEALTSHAAGKHNWVATLIVEGSDLEDARERRDRAIDEVRERYDLKTYSDESPRAWPGRL